MSNSVIIGSDNERRATRGLGTVPADGHVTRVFLAPATHRQRLLPHGSVHYTGCYINVLLQYCSILQYYSQNSTRDSGPGNTINSILNNRVMSCLQVSFCILPAPLMSWSAQTLAPSTGKASGALASDSSRWSSPKKSPGKCPVEVDELSKVLLFSAIMPYLKIVFLIKS